LHDDDARQRNESQKERHRAVPAEAFLGNWKSGKSLKTGQWLLLDPEHLDRDTPGV